MFQDEANCGSAGNILSPAPPRPANHVEDTNPDFPHGGASLLSLQEAAETHTEAKAEFEREASQEGHDSKKKKKNVVADDPDAELGSLFSDELTGKFPRFAIRIILKNISPGMKLWGIIVEVKFKKKNSCDQSSSLYLALSYGWMMSEYWQW